MTSIGTTTAQSANDVIVGVDTHKDVHVAVAIDGLGRRLGDLSVPTTGAGLRSLLAWAQTLGPARQWGLEGPGSYGAGLTRYLRHHGEAVLEVSRPGRRLRRERGKSDQLDAEAAARALLAGESCGSPRQGIGTSEALRQLRAARRSAIKARTQAANLLQALLVTAPADLRANLDTGTLRARVTRCAALRPGRGTDASTATKIALRSAARRWQHLDAEIRDLDEPIKVITAEAAPQLLAQYGVGPDVAAALLITAGGHQERLQAEPGFAALCGVSPLPASSGKSRRHRLNRGGDRQANSALHTVAVVRMRSDPRTRQYVERRTREGLARTEILRCLKRYIARELHPLLLLAQTG